MALVSARSLKMRTRYGNASRVEDSIVSPFIWYDLSETTGLVCSDNQGNGPDGTVVGVTTSLHANLPWWTITSNAFNEANWVNFIGDLYINSLFPFATLGDGMVLMHADYWASPVVDVNHIMVWGDSLAPNIDFSIRRNVDDIIQYRFKVDGMPDTFLASSIITNGQRYSIMAAVDGLNKTLRGWLNGVELSSVDKTAEFNAVTAAHDASSAANHGLTFFARSPNTGAKRPMSADNRAKQMFAMRLGTHPGETFLATLAQEFYARENSLPSVLRGK